MNIHQVLNLEERHAHRDAERLRFLAPCYYATIVIREHDNGSAQKLRVEDALTGGVVG
jgi:hypothetical protein